MFVFDTSAYINGQRDHLPIATFPTVWQHVAEAIDASRIVLPREVFRELTAIDDELAGVSAPGAVRAAHGKHPVDAGRDLS